MGTTFYQADKTGFATEHFQVEVSLSSAHYILESIGLETEGPQGTVGTINNKNIPEYMIALSRAMFNERNSDNKYVMDRWTRLQRLFVAAYDSGYDVGWS